MLVKVALKLLSQRTEVEAKVEDQKGMPNSKIDPSPGRKEVVTTVANRAI